MWGRSREVTETLHLLQEPCETSLSESTGVFLGGGQRGERRLPKDQRVQGSGRKAPGPLGAPQGKYKEASWEQRGRRMSRRGSVEGRTSAGRRPAMREDRAEERGAAFRGQAGQEKGL